MDQPSMAVAQAVLQATIGAGVGALILAALRDMRRRWSLLAALVGLGVLLRAGTGLALFWISYLDLPILGHLHDGQGFWKLALDARMYFEVAGDASERGLWTISSGSSSPAYVRALALWMKLVGVSPASGLFLNLACYVLICWLVVRLARRGDTWSTAPLVVTLVSFTLSPAFVLVTAQSLKDAFFVTLVATVCVGWFWVAGPMARGTEERGYWPPLLLGLSVLSICTFLIAGVRPYYALFVWGAAASTLPILLFSCAQGTRLRHGLTGVVAIVLIWTAFMLGAGPYYELYAPARFLVRQSVTSTLTRVDSAREGFVLAGGSTNIVIRARRDRGAGVSPTADEPTAVDRVIQTIVGAAVLFVPISLLKMLSVVDFMGGRGLLFITDADTVFFDGTLAASLGVLLAARRRVASWLPLVWFLIR